MNKSIKRMTAQQHNTLMQVLFAREIENSVQNSKIYGDVNEIKEDHLPIQIFKNTDSVSALFDVYDSNKKICLLNFASYRHPGGGFINGSMAQEEALCHESTLYEVISDVKFKEYYDWNNEHLNNSLYLDRAIYSPDIIFTRDKSIKIDVLTCAAPNIGFSNSELKEENYEILKQRMQFISNILEENKVNIFIAGAFGCGVFGQNPNEVASIWKSGLKYGSSLKTIVHAVPGNDKNAIEFAELFVNKQES